MPEWDSDCMTAEPQRRRDMFEASHKIGARCPSSGRRSLGSRSCATELTGRVPRLPCQVRRGVCGIKEMIDGIQGCSHQPLR
jgi:hypothetical protein